MKPHRFGLLGCAIVLNAGCGVSAPANSPDAWQRVFVRSDGWTGGDCAASCELPGGRVLWTFADSWVGRVRNGRRLPGAAMINNAVAVHPASKDRLAPPADQVRFAFGPAAPDGKPTAWLRPTLSSDEARDPLGKRWYWAIGGGLVVPRHNGRQLLLFFSSLRAKTAGESDWNFEDGGSVLAVVENPEAELSQWRVRQFSIMEWPRNAPASTRRIRWGAAMLEDRTEQDEPCVLIYGVDIADGLNKKLVLARCVPDRVEQFDAWQFRSRRGWSASVNDAVQVCGDVMDELSVSRVEWRGRQEYVLVYSKPFEGERILARTGQQADGPWSAPRIVHHCPEPSRDRRLMTYAAKAHAELSRPGELLITYCVNSNDFFHMAADASVYHPRFVSVPLEAVFEPPSPSSPCEHQP